MGLNEIPDSLHKTLQLLEGCWRVMPSPQKSACRVSSTLICSVTSTLLMREQLANVRYSVV
jgi:hypothetical protein